MSTLYPVAKSVDEALQAPKGLAAREKDAQILAGAAVMFVAETVGPTFATREALTEAFRSAVSQPWSSVRPVSDAKKIQAPVKPINRDGRRWPQPKTTSPALWRLSISYWKIGGEESPTDHARSLRRDPDAGELDAKALRALARQPLRALKPQQPLDIGLFEVRPPEAPHIVMPDE